MTEFLTRERELELGKRIQSYIRMSETSEKDSEIERLGIAAIEELVENNVRLVYNLANGYKRKHPAAGEIEDLIQDGMLGMMKAIYKYDPERGNKFSTVAHMWILQNIGRTSNETSRLVRLPENRIMDYIKMREIEKTVLENDGTLAEADEIIMEELGLDSTKIRELRAASNTHASLNKIVGSEDGEGREFGEFFSSDEELESDVLEGEMFSTVSHLLEEMTLEQQKVLASAFALSIPGIETSTPREVKKELKITGRKFNSILDETIESMRSSLESLGLEFSDFIL